jgi:hypothetical protein
MPTINPGDIFKCCMCEIGDVEIPADADPEGLATLNETVEEQGAVGLLCDECAATLQKNAVTGRLAEVVS